MAKTNLDIPDPFVQLMDLGGKRGSRTRTLCAALRWFFVELMADEREAGLDALDGYEGLDSKGGKGLYKPGTRCLTVVAMIDDIMRELRRGFPSEKQRKEYLARKLTQLRQMAAAGIPPAVVERWGVSSGEQLDRSLTDGLSSESKDDELQQPVRRRRASETG